MMVDSSTRPPPTPPKDIQYLRRSDDATNNVAPRLPAKERIVRSPSFFSRSDDKTINGDYSKTRRRIPTFWRQRTSPDNPKGQTDVTMGTSKSMSTKPEQQERSRLSPSPSVSSFGGFRHWRSNRQRADSPRGDVPASPRLPMHQTVSISPTVSTRSTTPPSLSDRPLPSPGIQLADLAGVVHRNNTTMTASPLETRQDTTTDHELDVLTVPLKNLELEFKPETRDSTANDEALNALMRKYHDTFPVSIVPEPAGYVIESPSTSSFAPMTLKEASERSRWFRNHFVGKFYTTFVGYDAGQSTVISVVPEINSIGPHEESGYRIILRTSELAKNEYHKVSAHQLLETKSQLQQGIDVSRKRTPSFSFLNSETHRLAVATACPHLNVRPLHELAAETTILAGLEKELLRFDEMEFPRNFKFGVLTVKQGQKTEEAWFSNSDMSPAFQEFMDAIGTKVELKGFDGYAAGLDTRAGETGEISYAGQWQNHQIMFHVAPLMPCRENDKQQVHRKRYIGNDIACVVFVEGGKFDPTMIRSQFLHIFIVVRPEGNGLYTVEVVRSSNVKAFGPPLPYPSIFKTDQLRSFIINKLVHAEYAALQSDKFAIPTQKARINLLNDLAQRCLAANRKPKRRPRSANVPRSSRLPADAPPVPTRSRSTMLRDLTSLARRRRSSSSENTINASQESLNQPAPSISTIMGDGIRTRAHSLMSAMQRARTMPSIRNTASPPVGAERPERPFI